jgi:RNA polymerase sigma factor (sigma-70 family)
MLVKINGTKGEQMSTDISHAVDTLPGVVEPLVSHGDQPDDEFLISTLARGAAWAMDPLYERYSGLLYSLAYHMVMDSHVAEDLLQDVFLAVWRHAASYTPTSGTVRNWLISMMRHRTIDYLRAVRCRSLLKAIPLEEAEVDERTSYPDVWEAVWRLVQGMQVRAALSRIPSEQRKVIELAFFQGWTHSEIAREHQLPLGTVKGRMRSGLFHLKHELEAEGIIESGETP